MTTTRKIGNGVLARKIEVTGLNIEYIGIVYSTSMFWPRKIEVMGPNIEYIGIVYSTSIRNRIMARGSVPANIEVP